MFSLALSLLFLSAILFACTKSTSPTVDEELSTQGYELKWFSSYPFRENCNSDWDCNNGASQENYRGDRPYKGNYSLEAHSDNVAEFQTIVFEPDDPICLESDEGYFRIHYSADEPLVSSDFIIYSDENNDAIGLTGILDNTTSTRYDDGYRRYQYDFDDSDQFDFEDVCIGKIEIALFNNFTINFDEVKIRWQERVFVPDTDDDNNPPPNDDPPSNPDDDNNPPPDDSSDDSAPPDPPQCDLQSNSLSTQANSCTQPPTIIYNENGFGTCWSIEIPSTPRYRLAPTEYSNQSGLISINFNRSTAFLGLNCTSTVNSTLQNLFFSIRSDVNGKLPYSLSVTDSNGTTDSIRLINYISNSGTNRTWYNVEIPFEDINIESATFNGIQFVNGSRNITMTGWLLKDIFVALPGVVVPSDPPNDGEDNNPPDDNGNVSGEIVDNPNGFLSFPLEMTIPESLEGIIPYAIEPFAGQTTNPYNTRVVSVNDTSSNAGVTLYNGKVADVGIQDCAPRFASVSGWTSNDEDLFPVSLLNYDDIDRGDDTSESEAQCLSYQNHRGYDFAYGSHLHGEDILASTEGFLCVMVENGITVDNSLYTDPTICGDGGDDSALQKITYPSGGTYQTQWEHFNAVYIVYDENRSNSLDQGDYMTFYLHASNIEDSILSLIRSRGYARVTRGQKIGEVGNTGPNISTHLHFNVKDSDWNNVDPYGNSDTNFDNVLWDVLPTVE